MRKLLLLTFSFAFILPVSAVEYELRSPDGKLKAEIGVMENILVILKKEGDVVLKLENLSLETENNVLQKSDFKIRKIQRNSINETLEPSVREKAESFTNIYNELEIRFRNKWGITFRLFNEGFAFRFSTSLKDSLTIYRESIELCFDENDSVWFQPSESFNSSYETPYEHRAVFEIEKGQLCHLPLLAEKKSGHFVLVTEADLYNYPGLWFTGTGEARLTGTNPPYPKDLVYTGSIYRHGQISDTYNYIAKVKGDRSYPWRVFAVAGSEKDLIANNMVYLLSTPNALEDISWINPGVVMFDWWAKNNIYGVDFTAGINTETAKYFIDFCADHGFRYFLFDDGWSPKEDLLTVVPDLDMAEVTAYAKSRGVDVMLWVIWHALEKQWDEVFDLFEKWGIRGIKMDFMNRDDQKMVEFYEAVAKKAAEKKMVVNFHGAYKPAGLRRKYPNVLTREALIEFEYNGWTAHDNPEHHNLLPYIRMVTGPMDYIPGTMRNTTKDNFRPVGDYPMGQGTRAHALALFVILNSPMTMLPDSPSDYYREKECTGFLAKIPVEWNETRLLKGEIAKYTVLARRSGSDWYIGAITNWDSRTVEINTNFLEPGEYLLEAVEDGVNANTRAEDYRMLEKRIAAGDTLTLKLASGGGWTARITPLR
jgi:alpha-glucosidase